MSEPNAEIIDDPEHADTEVDNEASALAVDMGGNKMVPLSALIASKKESKGYRDRVKELEPIAANVTTVSGQLAHAQPIIDAILNNPKLKAEALRIAGGTRSTAESTEQPDDVDAIAMAEEMGFYQADGVTPDAARGARVLSRLDARHGKQTDERIRPLAGITLNQKANANLAEAVNAVDSDGTPLATRESIKEVASQLPPQLLADPAVVDLVLNSAIGLDKRKNRTPKAPDEPLYLDRNGGSRQPREAALPSNVKAFLKAQGISEDDYRKSSTRLEEGAASRRGIELGKN